LSDVRWSRIALVNGAGRGPDLAVPKLGDTVDRSRQILVELNTRFARTGEIGFANPGFVPKRL
jgi:hypothetical protein